MSAAHQLPNGFSGPILQARGLTKRYGGVVANENVDFSVNAGEVRGIIGPNGAGKTTFFKMLTCEVPPTAGRISFRGQDITGKSVTDVCQLGLTKSYQVNQLFNRLTVRENVTIAALAALRGKFRLDLLRSLRAVRGLDEQVDATLAAVQAADDKPYVVPNPYVGSAAFEPERFAVSGRGVRRLEFRALPPSATIRIFNVRGDLVQSLRHDGSTAGFVAWDLRTKDNLDVAPGLYIFRVEAPGTDPYTGKFAVIK